MNAAPAITAAVCTHNGAARLPAVLDSLLGQQTGEAAFEVLVVTNACTDDSPRIARHYAARAGDRLRIVAEPRLGLSNARNRALAEAAAPIVAFTDDDATAEADWLASLLAVYAAEPAAVCVGGRIHLKWERPKPAWWTDRLDEVFGWFDYPQARMAMHHPRYPYGGNISFRRQAALAVGGFNPSLGRVGRRLVAGEEGELCYKLERAGGTILYDRGPLVHHSVRPDRLTRRFILRRALMHGRSQAVCEAHHRMADAHMPRTAALVADLLGSCARRRCDLPKLKWLAYRFGYRFQRLCHRLAAAEGRP
jgi:glycosyltransferase involved in cell wall biosynthesis